MTCGICNSEMVPHGSAVVLGRHEAAFLRCPSCGFIRAESPMWLPDAYIDPINASDIGLLSRNVELAQRTAKLIAISFDRSGRFLDFGGGYGVFTRLMRDRGLDFQMCDEFCDNLFATGFEVEADALDTYELITAFEVVEHLVEPVEELGRLFEHSGSVLIATELVPDPAPALGNWWYYGLEHGQHVSFFTKRALGVVARRFDRTLVSDGRSLHLVTDRSIDERLYRAIVGRRFAWLTDRITARRFAGRSLLQSDRAHVAGS